MTEQEAIKNFQGENKILSQYAETKFQKAVFAKKIERNNMAIKALEKQRNNGWIPVDERLPEDGVRVLTCDNYKNMHVMRHYNFYEYPFCIGPEHERYYMPKAWMELPEPYKECEEE